MILGKAGRTSGHLRVGPYFPEEVVYVEFGPDGSEYVRAVKVLQPGHWLWDWNGKELLVRPVPGEPSHAAS